MSRYQSIREMVITLPFLGLAAYWLIFSLDLLQNGELWRGMGGLLAAACCGLGSLRFFIAAFVAKWRKN